MYESLNVLTFTISESRENSTHPPFRYRLLKAKDFSKVTRLITSCEKYQLLMNKTQKR